MKTAILICCAMCGALFGEWVNPAPPGSPTTTAWQLHHNVTKAINGAPEHAGVLGVETIMLMAIWDAQGTISQIESEAGQTILTTTIQGYEGNPPFPIYERDVPALTPAQLARIEWLKSQLDSAEGKLSQIGTWGATANTKLDTAFSQLIQADLSFIANDQQAAAAGATSGQANIIEAAVLGNDIAQQLNEGQSKLTDAIFHPVLGLRVAQQLQGYDEDEWFNWDGGSSPVTAMVPAQQLLDAALE